VITFSDLEFIENFAQELRSLTGFETPIAPLSSKSKNVIKFEVKDLANSNVEAYDLDIDPDRILISANTEKGLFLATKTLSQLLPSKTERKISKEKEILVASGKIVDAPRFGYRGAMLDVSRHFFEVENVKTYIDHLSNYKINTLHLHLSDDQGWRIEIKSWPKLTSIGGLTQVGGGKGGFYTQDEYRDIVRYAKSKYITIIPEIDIPGHTNAALVAYPKLNCNKKDPNPKAYTGMRVGFSTLCTRNPEVYDFLDDVIKELAAMTPGEYIHIGGDESHVTSKSDYIYFLDKVQKIVSKHGKKVMGWDDISAANLSPESIAQHWSDPKNARKAIAKNAKIVMSPAKKTYLDMQYDSTTEYGLHWAAYIELDSAYIWDPATIVSGINESDILGVESPLWSETIEDIDEIEYMAFPRIIGHAEIGWTNQKLRNWEDYKTRLAKHEVRLIENEIDFYRSDLIER